MRARLMYMLRQLIVDLDQDRVSQDEFEHFSFTWGAVDTLVRDRLNTTNRVDGEGWSDAEGAQDG